MGIRKIILASCMAFFPMILISQVNNIELPSEVNGIPASKFELKHQILNQTNSIGLKSNGLNRFSTTEYSEAFFCRLESKVEKKSEIPVRLRLGETSQVDRMEEKFSLQRE